MESHKENGNNVTLLVAAVTLSESHKENGNFFSRFIKVNLSKDILYT